MEAYREYEVINDLNFSNTAFKNMEFVECKFENCEFENIHLYFCKFIDCIFINCRVINPVFDNCSMTGSDFTECRLFGVNWSGLSYGFVSPIEHMKACKIQYNDFISCNYPKFLFEGNEILESLFSDCNLSRSRFNRCRLNKTEFVRCDLTGASFENAEGYAVDITSCKLKGAVFTFPEVTNLLNGLGIVIK